MVMDTLLIVVTGVSLALAVVMGILLARLLRVERRRSDARVQLLEDLAAGTAGRSVASTPATATTRARLGSETPLPQDDTPAFLRPSSPHVSQAYSRPGQPADDLPLHDTSPGMLPRHELFQEITEASPVRRHFAGIAGVAAMLAIAILGWTQVHGRDATPPAQSTIAAASSSPSLELLSLRHSREGNTLTVAGLVQNSGGSAPLSNVQATVFVFGTTGTLITSGRAPIDFTSLAPGEESPFVIRVPVSGNVARYRVGFRGADDRVLAHVDRRTDQVGRAF